MTAATYEKVRKGELFERIRAIKAQHQVRRAYLEEDRPGNSAAYWTNTKAALSAVPPGRYRLVARQYINYMNEGVVLAYIEVPSSAAYERAQRQRAEAEAFERLLTDAYQQGRKNGTDSGACGFQWVRIAEPGGEPLYRPKYNLCLGPCTDGDCDHGKVPVEAILREKGLQWVWMWNAD